MNEFELIRRYFDRPSPSAVLGVGDDAALLQPTPGYLLAVSADMLVAGRHFLEDADPFLLGRKTLAVNLSDLAAMGAAPRWATLSVALPQLDETWLTPFVAGLFSIADEFGLAIVGGDTTRGPLTLSVQIIGEVMADQALRRDQAVPGDDIWVSGTLGDAALGLAHLQGRVRLNERDAAVCLDRLHAPLPRVSLGLALRGTSHCAIDISDGLLGDIGHILERSHCGADLDIAALPVSPALRAHMATSLGQQCLLAGGDDYELCFTVPTGRRQQIADMSATLGLSLTRIGRMTTQPGLRLHDAQGPLPLPEVHGFDHFS